MSNPVFEQHVDEFGNISVRVSQDIVVLTRDDADRLMARFDQLKAENVRLREQIHWLKQGDILHVLTDQEYIDQCERERLMQVSIDALDKDNARLRELAEKAWKAAEMLCQAWEGPCHADGVSIKPPCPLDERDELCVYGLIQRDLRELGIEVE